MQLPLVHSVALPQVRPLGLVVLQVESALQNRLVLQSPSPTQVVLHAVPAPLHL